MATIGMAVGGTVDVSPSDLAATLDLVGATGTSTATGVLDITGAGTTLDVAGAPKPAAELAVVAHLAMRGTGLRKRRAPR
ncbi:MAG: hypothetical protein KGK10_05865 [Rhodospirillales bacterium]|nr:hypothetical protein [Rhodospirillales bacterium]